MLHPPLMPGSFPILVIYILAEKAADLFMADGVQDCNDEVLVGVREMEVLEEDRHNKSMSSSRSRYRLNNLGIQSKCFDSYGCVLATWVQVSLDSG